jgi:hypothetical protein
VKGPPTADSKTKVRRKIVYYECSECGDDIPSYVVRLSGIVCHICDAEIERTGLATVTMLAFFLERGGEQYHPVARLMWRMVSGDIENERGEKS